MWWKDARGRVAITLFVVWFTSRMFFLHTLLSVGFVLGIDLLLAKIFRGKYIFSLSSLVTGFLIGLVADPTGGATFIFITAVCACLSKYFIRINKKHIFNPACFGLLVSSFIFNRPVSWWGSPWGFFPMVIFVVGVVPVLLRLRRIWMPVTFLVAYFLTFFIRVDAVSAIRLTVDGTVLLFALVMLPEPMTSFGRGPWRYLWGVFVGGLVAIQAIFPLPTDPFLTALLLANLLTP